MQPIEIEVVYADDAALIRQTVRFATSPTVTEALAAASDIPKEATLLPASVWGRRVEGRARLVHRDRLELTRNLVADPKHSRARKVNAKPRRGWVSRVV